jgi:hypothetical protein
LCAIELGVGRCGNYNGSVPSRQHKRATRKTEAAPL